MYYRSGTVAHTGNQWYHTWWARGFSQNDVISAILKVWWLTLQDKRTRHKFSHQLPPDCCFTCNTCSRVCASRIGLFSHLCTHHTISWSGDP